MQMKFSLTKFVARAHEVSDPANEIQFNKICRTAHVIRHGVILDDLDAVVQRGSFCACVEYCTTPSLLIEEKKRKADGDA